MNLLNPAFAIEQAPCDHCQKYAPVEEMTSVQVAHEILKKEARKREKRDAKAGVTE